MKTRTKILIAALRQLEHDIQSQDGIPNATVAEAAQRLEYLQEKLDNYRRMGTGLSDSNGVHIRVGDVVRHPVGSNLDFHGTWAEYKIILRGLTPVLSYFTSEKGQVLPEGYLSSPLHEKYDDKNFLFATDLLKLRPKNELVVIRKEEQ